MMYVNSPYKSSVALTAPRQRRTVPLRPAAFGVRVPLGLPVKLRVRRGATLLPAEPGSGEDHG